MMEDLVSAKKQTPIWQYFSLICLLICVYFIIVLFQILLLK